MSQDISASDNPPAAVLACEMPALAAEVRKLVADEDFRTNLRTLLSSPRVSWWARFAKNDFTKLLVGFILTGVVGGLLTDYYSRKQRESDALRQVAIRESERLYQQRQFQIQRASAFADKVNEIRVQKITAVWEQLGLYESAAARVFGDPDSVSTAAADDAMFMKLQQAGVTTSNFREFLNSDAPVAKEIRADQAARDQLYYNATKGESAVMELATRNRLWLGERRYGEIQKYLTEIAPLLRAAKQSDDLSPELLKRRAELRITFASLRNSWLDED